MVDEIRTADDYQQMAEKKENNMASTANAKKKLQKDLESVISDAKELINAAAGDANEKTQAALARLQESLENARDKFDEMEGKAEAAVRTGKELIGEYPYQTVGISLAFGILMGMLLRRK